MSNRLTPKHFVIVFISSVLSWTTTVVLMNVAVLLYHDGWAVVTNWDEFVNNAFWFLRVVVIGGAGGGVILAVIWVLLIVAGRAPLGIGSSALAGTIGGLLVATILIVAERLLERHDVPWPLLRSGIITLVAIVAGAAYGALLACFTRLLGSVARLRVQPKTASMP